MDSPIEYMKELSLFKGFSQQELEILSTVFNVRRFADRQTVCREGDATASLFIVVAGGVEAYKDLGEGRRLALGTAGKNCLVGQKSLIDGGRRSAGMTAVGPTVVLECNRADFQRLFSANSVFAYKVIDFVVTDLSNRLRASDRSLEVMLQSPEQTLDTVLNTLSEVSGNLGAGGKYEDPGRKNYTIEDHK
jgi:CRP/FNR family transcriptional regulator, cyclic AMP receptor protein